MGGGEEGLQELGAIVGSQSVVGFRGTWAKGYPQPRWILATSLCLVASLGSGWGGQQVLLLGYSQPGESNKAGLLWF